MTQLHEAAVEHRVTAFRPRTASPTNVECLRQIDAADVEAMSETEISDHRVEIIRLRHHLNVKLGETATERAAAPDEADVATHITRILEDGFRLLDTGLAQSGEFRDIQNDRRYASLIRVLVEASPFAEKRFKIHDLRLQRSEIARSKTIHELRQAVRRMIGPLRLHRDACGTEAVCERFRRGEHCTTELSCGGD